MPWVAILSPPPPPAQENSLHCLTMGGLQPHSVARIQGLSPHSCLDFFARRDHRADSWVRQREDSLHPQVPTGMAAIDLGAPKIITAIMRASLCIASIGPAGWIRPRRPLRSRRGCLCSRWGLLMLGRTRSGPLWAGRLPRPRCQPRGPLCLHAGGVSSLGGGLPGFHSLPVPAAPAPTVVLLQLYFLRRCLVSDLFSSRVALIPHGGISGVQAFPPSSHDQVTVSE
jgi:hypothetical protein